MATYREIIEQKLRENFERKLVQRIEEFTENARDAFEADLPELVNEAIEDEAANAA